MNKVIDYKAVISHNYRDLEFEVKRLLPDGWVPQGSIAAGSTSTKAGAISIIELTFIQAMVKYE